MRTALGIDTGGTFTDGVLIDIDTREILKTAKTPTIHHDLQFSIDSILQMLCVETGQKPELLSLSTTLATNACVENRFQRCGLVLFGSSEKEVERYGGSVGLLSTSDIYFARGAIDMDGVLCEEPDWKQFRHDTTDWCRGFSSFAVVSKWGMKNHQLEQTAKECLTETTNKPVVCGYELSSDLNYFRRAVSARLNAQLTPVFIDFLDNVKKSLEKRNMHPLISIVRGDGSVMSEEYARTKPVDTLLSGPAASVLGALALVPGKKDMIVVDIGGTTTDVTIVENASPHISSEGAQIGAFRTATKALNTSTILLGGDTELIFDRQEGVSLGERRIMPLSMLAAQNTAAAGQISESDEWEKSGDPFVFYLRHKAADEKRPMLLTEKESALLQAVTEQPWSADALKARFGRVTVDIRHLEAMGLVLKSALTPTDIMHAAGDCSIWNAAAAEKAVRFYANRVGCDSEELCGKVYRLITDRLYRLIVKKLLVAELSLQESEAAALCEHLRELTVYSKRRYTELIFHPRYPIVGIGAPSQVLLKGLGELFGTPCLTHPEAKVGNAVGTVLGEIVGKSSVEIRDMGDEFAISGDGGIIGYFTSLKEAETFAAEVAGDRAVHELFKRGGRHPRLTVEKIELQTKPYTSSLVKQVLATASCSVLEVLAREHGLDHS